MLLEMSHLVLLGTLECPHALEHLVPINQSAVKFRAVYAYEFCLSAYRQTASTAHARTVHHDCIKRDICRYVVFLRKHAAELHHYRRPDGKDFVNMLLLYEFLHSNSYNSLLAIRTVIGHYYEFIAAGANFVFQYYKFLIAPCNDRKHTVARRLQCLYNRQHGGNPHSTAGTNHSTVILYFCWIAERPYNVCNIVTFIQKAQLC